MTSTWPRPTTAFMPTFSSAAHATPGKVRLPLLTPLRHALRRRTSPYSSIARRVHAGNKLPPIPPPSGSNRRPDDDDENEQPSKNPLTLYLRLLDSFPLPTKIATSALLTLLSDLIAQLFESRSQSPSQRSLNKRRLLSLFLIGGLLTAPLFHHLYAALEFYLPTKGSPVNLLLQLTIDQLVAAPGWLLLFFASISAMEGRFDLAPLEAQIRRDFIPALKLTWTIFPPVQLISFAFLPPTLRLLTLNVVDLVFTGALSYLKHRPLPSPA